MAAISSSIYLEPTSRLLEQSAAEPSWRVVTVHRTNKKGELITYPSGIPIKFSYIEEVATGDLYIDDTAGKHSRESPLEDTQKVVREKCIGVMIGSPFYGAGLIITKLFNIALHICYIAYKTIQNFAKDWQEKSKTDALKDLVLGFVWELPKAVVLDLWIIVKTPFFVIAMSATSAIGIIDPFLARKLVGRLEYILHDFVTYRQDLRHKKDPNDCPPFTLDEILEGKTYFLAYCFQVRGNINDGHYVRLED